MPPGSSTTRKAAGRSAQLPAACGAASRDCLILAFILLAGGAAPAAHAQEAGLPESAGCKAAREDLESSFNDPAINRAERLARVKLAQQRTARACLGASHGPAQRSGAPQPAQAVPPPRFAAVPVAPASPPAPPPASSAPAAITTCDSAGCWDSAGRRLNSLGPMLIGPKGPCTVQGALVNCP